MTDQLSLTVNGEPRRFASGSIADLVRSLELDPVKVAVERNGVIVPRSTLGELANFFTQVKAALPVGFNYTINGQYQQF